ncbi:Calcium-transporting ATPase [Handroanthus impetiginosus]|uniref:Calcium-transporting ATPase n=1 Tax=Handroanthus impetiginosus TaxID=429701 RepID=A0A2G9GCJ8_9LAMI|nr:Calcium-transporting ATPase [Handroanthus impetiginosus]
MGIEGDESTRSSDIIILDGKHSSLTLIMRWASCTSNNTQMFLQFQLTTSITSILNTYISTVSFHGTLGVDTRLVYVLVQLIWVNLGMGLIAAVIFGRQKPDPCKYKPPAEGKKGQLVTGFMWRNITAQVAYQVIAMSILQFQGPPIFGDEKNDTITFVVPIFLQILAHSMDFVGLDWKQWTLCIGIGLACWLVCFAVKFVPGGFLVSPCMVAHYKLRGMLRQLKS